MSMMGRIGCVVAGLCMIVSVSANVVLVEDGEARMPIVVFENAPPFTRRAADDLADYLEKSTGARPDVLEGQPDPLPASAIWVGYQPAMDALFPDLNFDFAHPEEILIAANDGWREGHCVCAGCLAWDHPEGQRVRFIWSGLSQDYVALSDRQVTFANHLSERLTERFPDKDLKVVMLAYGLSRPPPVEAVAGDGVIVGLVHNFLQRHAPEDRNAYQRWAEASAHPVWRPNIGAVRMKEGGPIDLNAAMETFRLVGKSGAIGINIDTVMLYWATQGPLYYLMAQLAWDPSQDGQAIMDDYYARGFGLAAEPIAAYWDLLAETRREIDREGVPWGEAFVPHVFERAGALLDEADAKVDGARDVYAQRIAFFRAGLDFLRLTTENLAILSRLDLERPDDEDALARAKANWAEIDRISREFPYAFNVGHVQRNPGGGRLRGIYPHRD